MIRTRPTDFVNRRLGGRFPNYSNLSQRAMFQNQGAPSRVNAHSANLNFLSGSSYPGMAQNQRSAPLASVSSPENYLGGWQNNLWSITPESIAFAGLGINQSGEMYNFGRPSFTPSASTLPTDYNPSSQMYWLAPGYQARPRTETQQRLLNSPIYEVGPNLSQEGRDVAALWGIDLSEKPEGWKFRPISYQEFYGKPTPTDMLGGEYAQKWESDKSGQSDPEYVAYVSEVDARAEAEHQQAIRYVQQPDGTWQDPVTGHNSGRYPPPDIRTSNPQDYLSWLLGKKGYGG